MQYGMGTYIRELTEALLENTDIILYVVTYRDSEFKEFTIETISSRYFKIQIPAPKITSPQNNLFEKRYSSTVVKMLSGVIPKKGDIVFQMNYIDDLPIIIKLKEEYDHPVITVIHFAQWQQLFNGNRQKISGLNINKPENNIEYTLFKEREMYQASDHIVSITNYMKDFLVEHYDVIPDKIALVRNGINYKRFHTISPEEKSLLKHNLGFSPQEKIILFSGRIDPAKGVFFLLEAFEQACKYADNLRLVLMGQGNIQDCFHKYQSYYGKITFTGFLPSDQVMAFYRITDIGVFPSLFEQCPYTVLEMIANRIPLIMSNINGLKEILDGSQCVFIDPVISENGEISLNNKELANAILTLAGDAQLSKELALSSYKTLVDNFSTDRMASEMNKLYSELLNKKPKIKKYETHMIGTNHKKV